MGTFDSVYVNEIKKLQEENLRLKRYILNEMAVTPGGADAARWRVGDDPSGGMRGYVALADTIEDVNDALEKYHGLLKEHPTKIFDATGRHVGNIVHQALPGHEGIEMGEASAEEVADHEVKIGEAARVLNNRINRHNRDAQYHDRGYLITDAHRPHPDHVSDGERRNEEDRRRARGPDGDPPVPRYSW